MIKNKLLIFTGQGSFTQADFLACSHTSLGKRLIRKYIVACPHSVRYLKSLLRGSGAINDLTSTLITFYCNDYFCKSHGLSRGDVDTVTYYSAGLFNALYFLGLVSLGNVLDLIINRSLMLSSFKVEFRMFMLFSNDVPKALEVNRSIVRLAIIFSDAIDVISLRDCRRFVSVCRDNDVLVKLLPVKVFKPYHTSLLNKYVGKYSTLVKRLHIHNQFPAGLLYKRQDSVSINKEILLDLNHVFNWNWVRHQVSRCGYSVIIDTSPNRFLAKSIYKLGR